jgi:glycosyltransferase involved in cell wall biosynthesis
MVTETYPPDVNGVAMTMERLVTGMLSRGHSIQLIRVKQDERDRRRDAGRLEVLPQRGLPIPCYRVQRFGLPAARSLTQLWRAHPADVAYIATEGPLGLSALMVARRLGIPVVSGFHTNFHTYSNHYHLGLLQDVVMAYMRRFHNRTACTVAPTPRLCDKLEDQGYETTRVLSRGVDTECYNPDRRNWELREQWGVGPDDPVVLYVGRLAGEKNLDLAVEAFRAMQCAVPGARFVLVGDGPMREEVESRHPEFIFCGMLTGESLYERYASADIFLFPSTTETFGNVTLEAMASGLAVLAYRYAAAEMHIRHGQNGLLAQFGDEDQFIARAVELVQDNELIRRLGHNARKAAEGVSWDNVCDDFERILRGVMVNHTETLHEPVTA